MSLKLYQVIGPEIVAYMKERPLEVMALGPLAEAIGKSRGTTKKALEVLCEEGKLEVFKYGGWILAGQRYHPGQYKISNALRAKTVQLPVEGLARLAKTRFEGKHPPRSVAELRTSLGVSHPRVYEVIKVLQEKGHLTRDRAGLHYHKEPVEPEIFDLV